MMRRTLLRLEYGSLQRGNVCAKDIFSARKTLGVGMYHQHQYQYQHQQHVGRMGLENRVFSSSNVSALPDAIGGPQFEEDDRIDDVVVGEHIEEATDGILLMGIEAADNKTEGLSEENDMKEPLERLQLNEQGYFESIMPRESVKDFLKTHKYKIDPEKIPSYQFGRLGLIPEIVEYCGAQDFTKPSAVQKAVIPRILGGAFENLIISSETGSGKTFAFLSGVAQLLKVDEWENGIPMKPGRPRALILTPSKELASQIAEVAKGLAHHTKLRSGAVTGASVTKKHETYILRDPVDILISTPDYALKLRDSKQLTFADVKYLVIDEADTILGNELGFRIAVEKLLRQMDSERGKLKQKIFAGATIVPFHKGGNKNASSLVGRDVQGLEAYKFIQTYAAKRNQQTSTVELRERVTLPAGLDLKIRECGSNDKFPQMASLLRRLMKDAKFKYRHQGEQVGKTLIFCNSINACRAATYFLEEEDNHIEGLGVYCLHGEFAPKRRQSIWRSFSQKRPSNVLEEHKVLITTDLSSRGLDMDVDAVILLDMPSSVTDFVHRVGRTARGPNAEGKAFALVGPKESEPMTAMIDFFKDNKDGVFVKNQAQLDSVNPDENKYLSRKDQQIIREYAAAKEKAESNARR